MIHFGKRVVSSIFVVILTFVMCVSMIGAMSIDVDAAGNLVQQGDLTTFAQDLPSATAFVDYDAIVEQLANDNYEFYTESSKLLIGKFNNIATGNPSQSVEIKFTEDSPITPGEYDVPSYKMVYRGVVELSDGTKADLEATYTPVKAYASGYGEIPYFQLYKYRNVPVGVYATIAGIGIGDELRKYYQKQDPKTWQYISAEVQIDVNITQGGNIVDKTLLMSCNDLDNAGILTSAAGTELSEPMGSARAFYTQNTDINYDETLTVDSGLLSNIVYPEGSYLTVDDNNNLRPTKADSNTYYAGYATLLNASHSFTWTGTSCGTSIYYNKSDIAHTVRAETVGTYPEGGAIELKTTQGATVTASTANESGTYKAGLAVPDHNDVTCTITVEEGYELDTVMVDGQVITPIDNGDGTYTYTFLDNTADHKIEASFKKKPVVTYETDGNGDITGQTNETVDFDGNPTGTTQKNHDGYKFSYYTADKDVTLDDTVIHAGDEITEEQLKKIIVKEDLTITANYEPIPVPVTVTVTYTTDGNGRVDKESEVVEVEGNPGGTKQTPNQGYVFKNYTANKDVTLKSGKVIKAGDPITEEEITQVVVTEDITFTANYEKVKEQTTVQPKSQKPTTPNTGDQNDLAFWMMLLSSSILGITAINRRKIAKHYK